MTKEWIYGKRFNQSAVVDMLRPKILMDGGGGGAGGVLECT